MPGMQVSPDRIALMRKGLTGFRHERLRQLREAAGLTQMEAAAQIGVGFRTYNRWESGSGYPSVTALPRVAEVLGCDPSDLLPAPTNLTQLRQTAGLSQAQLARDLGVSRQLVSQWELGATPIASTHHRALANVFGLSTEAVEAVAERSLQRR